MNLIKLLLSWRATSEMISICPIVMPRQPVFGPQLMLQYSDHDARRAYARHHYLENKDKYIARARIHDKKRRTEILVFVFDYLKTHPCIDCGNNDPIVLEFDHRVGEKKSFNVSDFARSGYSLSTVKAEIEKCDVRCANCHRLATYRRALRTHRG